MADTENTHNCTWFTPWLCENCNPNLCKNYTKQDSTRMIELNKIYNEDCLEGMKRIQDNHIDLVVTSPPYDNLRSYENNIDETWGEQVWKPIIKELHRVVKQGGIVVWIVNDATINGSESGTSFRQALHFIDCGFCLFDTMIWNKPNSGSIGSMNRYEQTMEYMFVFSKGKPNTTNIICDKRNKRGGEIQHGSIRQKDGSTKRTSNYGTKKVNEFGRRTNVWNISPEMRRNIDHPAPFPIKLAYDHIISWSNKGDTILDPFMGSGTTAIACIMLNRNFIGFELSKEYYDNACKRIQAELSQPTLF